MLPSWDWTVPAWTRSVKILLPFWSFKGISSFSLCNVCLFLLFFFLGYLWRSMYPFNNMALWHYWEENIVWKMTIWYCYEEYIVSLVALWFNDYGIQVPSITLPEAEWNPSHYVKPHGHNALIRGRQSEHQSTGRFRLQTIDRGKKNIMYMSVRRRKKHFFGCCFDCFFRRSTFET